jgi:hypothetical protein
MDLVTRQASTLGNAESRVGALLQHHWMLHHCSQSMFPATQSVQIYNTVESKFKVFLHLVFIFCSPGKRPIYTMYKLPWFSISKFMELYVLVVSEQEFTHYSPYTENVFLQNQRPTTHPSLVYACYCLVKVSFHVTDWPLSNQYPWVLTDLEKLAGTRVLL